MLTDKQKDQITTIHSVAADIQRWCLQTMEAGKVSRDQKIDIMHHATMIHDRAHKLDMGQKETVDTGS